MSRPDAIEAQEFVLRTLTPVHIGTGEEFSPGVDLFQFTQGFLHVLEMEQVLGAVRDQDALTAALAAQHDERREGLRQVLAQAGCTVDHVSRYVLEDGVRQKKETPAIRVQLRSGPGRFTIPGSSIKGSVRTLALQHLLEHADEQRRTQILRDLSERLQRETGPKVEARGQAWLEEPLLAPRRPRLRADFPHVDLMRCFRFSDAAFDSNCERVFRIRVHPGRPDGDKVLDFRVLAEGIAQASTTRLRIGFDAALERQGFGSHGLWEGAMPVHWQELADLSQRLALDTVRREADRFEALAFSDAAKRLAKHLQGELRGLDPRSVVLRLGFGIGWEGTTGGFLPAATRAAIRAVRWKGSPTRTWARQGFPRSRKLVEALWRPSERGTWQREEGLWLPLGWVVLEPADGARPPGEELRGRAAPPKAARRTQPRVAPSTSPRRSTATSAFRRGEPVRARVLEQRTKRGDLLFELCEDPTYRAHLLPGGPAAPNDLVPGEEVRLQVQVAQQREKRLGCHWVGRATESDGEGEP